MDEEKQPLLGNGPDSHVAYTSVQNGGAVADHVGCGAEEGEAGKAAPTVSPWRGRILSAIVAMLYFASISLGDLMMSQYLYERFGQVVFNSTNVTRTEQIPCVNVSRDDSRLRLQQQAQKLSSNFTMNLTLTCGLPGLVVIAFLGSYSDKLGRKFLFLLPIVGNVTRSSLTMAIIWWQLPLDWFYLGYALEGCCGYFPAMLVACIAYNADTTPPRKQRTIVFVVLDGLFSLSSCSVSFASGYVIQASGYFYPAVMMAGVSLVAGVIVTCCLPETRARPPGRLPSPLENFRTIASYFLSRGSSRRRLQYVLCMIAFVTMWTAALGSNAAINLYRMAEPFCWDAVKLSFFSLAESGSRALAAVFLITPLLWCLRDTTFAVLAFLSTAASYTLNGLATNDVMMYCVPVLGIFSSTLSSSMRSFVSRMTHPDHQAALLSCVAVLETATNSLSTALYSQIYSATLAVFPGTVFLVMAGLMFLTAVTLLVFKLVTPGRELVYEADIPPPSPPSQPQS